MTLKEKLMPPRLEFRAVNSDNTMPPEEATYQFNKWFDRYVLPLFENAVEVSGWEDAFYADADSVTGPDCKPTHRALLIGIEQLHKGVTKEEIVDLLSSINGRVKDNLLDQRLSQLADRIEKEGIRP